MDKYHESSKNQLVTKPLAVQLILAGAVWPMICTPAPASLEAGLCSFLRFRSQSHFPQES